MKAVLWTKFKDARHRTWSIFLSRPDITPELVDTYGVCIPDPRRIYINANMPRSSWPGTALHEILHASVDDLALPNEEKSVSVFAVHALCILTQLGFALPKPPRLPWPRQRKKLA